MNERTLRIFLKVLCLILISLLPFIGAAQTREVTGIVQDAKTNEAVVGASVRIKNGTGGTATDVNGRFRLQAAQGAVLVISITGYQSQEVIAAFDKPLSVLLQTNNSQLNEVVVQAFQSTTKIKVVNAVSTVNMKPLENLAGYPDVSSALQGRTPGLIITNGSGAPGALPGFSIRGGTAPLYVIDGIVQDQGTFNRLNNQDIASISILKDGASSAVYGALGGNGVILVTTKRGTIGKPKVNYNVEQQFNSPAYRTRMARGYEIARLQNQAVQLNYFNPVGSPVLPNSDARLEALRTGSDPVNNPDVDWIGLFTRDQASTQRHTLSVDGGVENTQYHFSMGYLNQNTLLRPIQDIELYTFRRYDVNANITHRFEKIGLTVGLDIKGSMEDKKGKTEGQLGGLGNRFFYEKAYNPDGTYAANSPALGFDPKSGYENYNTPQYNTRLNIDWNVPRIPGLTAKFWGNYQSYTNSRKNWNNAYVPSYDALGVLAPVATLPSLSLRKDVSMRYEFNAGFNYTRTFHNDHNLSASLFYNQQENTTDFVTAARSNFISSAVDQLFAGPAASSTTDAGATQGGRLGVIGVLTYDYKSKYLISGTFRQDGSDYYQEGKRWGFFPSVSLGWVASEEQFIKTLLDRANIDYLKIRGSYAKVGIEGARFAYFSNWPIGSAGFDIGGVRAPTVSTPGLVSPDLTWVSETTKNIGLEFGMFKNRLSVKADYFVNDFVNYLSPVISVYNTTLGTAFPTVILDDHFRRAGSEFEIGWRDKIGDVTYRIAGNLSFYDEIWVKRNEDPSVSSNPLRTTTYKTISDGTRMWIADGLYQNASDLLNGPKTSFSPSNIRTGDIRYKDVNGDGRIDADGTNGSDNVFNGMPNKPILQYGIDLGFDYKGFSFSTLLQGSGPSYKVYGTNVQSNGISRLRYEWMLDNWTPDNTDARFPILDPGSGTVNNQQNSTFWLVDSRYWRIKHVTVGYDFKPLLFKNKNFISNLRLSLAAQNLFTASPAKYYLDPEQGSVSFSNYPITRTFSAVLSVSF